MLPCYFVQELQRRKVRLEAELTQISHEMQEQCELSQQLLLNVLPHEIIPAFILSENSEEVFAETFSKCSIRPKKISPSRGEPPSKGWKRKTC